MGIKVRFTKVKSRKYYLLYYDRFGKRHWKTSKATSSRDAAIAAIKLEQTLENPSTDSPKTWDSFLECIREKQKHERPGTLRIQKKAISLFVEACHPDWADITADQVMRYERHVDDGKRDKSTVRMYLASMRALFNYAASRGVIQKVPKFHLPKIKQVSESRGKAVTFAEYQKLRSAAASVVGPENERDWHLLMDIAWESGMRFNELLNLSWENGKNKIFVNLTDDPPTIIFPAGLQKNKTYSEMVIIPSLLKLLTSIEPEKRKGYVLNLRGPRGTEIRDRNSASRIFRRIAVAADCYQSAGSDETVTMHDFRRAFGTRNSEKYSPAILAKLMRHSSISVTMQFYQRHANKDIAAIVNKE